MDSQKLQNAQNQIKKSSAFMICLFVLFGFLLLSILITAIVLITPFAVIGYIFFLLFPFLKDLYRINKNYKFDKIEYERKHN
jgi:4-hydroxybenzoate polyprenyltransferase